jgi:hypothetical protein
VHLRVDDLHLLAPSVSQGRCYASSTRSGNGTGDARLIQFLNGERLATGAVARQRFAKDPKPRRLRFLTGVYQKTFGA